MELLTAAQMRAIERAAIDSGAVTGLELMERAGRGVVEAIFAEWPELAGGGAGGEAGGFPPVAIGSGTDGEPMATPRGYLGTEDGQGARTGGPHRAVVLCGPGNNGGDGFVVARLLRERGWAVEVFLYGDAERLPPDARVNYERWRGMGEVILFGAPERMPDRQVDDQWWKGMGDVGEIQCANIEKADVIIDAVFGIGLSRGFAVPWGLNWQFHRLMSDCLWSGGGEHRPYVVAVDTVSEMDADSGRVIEADVGWGGEMGAHLTVTFHRPKVGHYLDEGPLLSNWLRVIDLGLPPAADEDEPSRFRKPDGRVFLTKSPAADWFLKELLRKGSAAHKYAHGHALVLSGPATCTGAARLAARGALRIGAGVVTVGAAREALGECAAQLTAVMLREVGDGAALAEVLGDARINALCLGPGLGLDDRARGLVAVALGVGAGEGDPAPGLTRGVASRGTSGGDRVPGSSPGRVGPKQRPMVIDADALTLIARDPALFAALHPACVLTPHHGEFGRLFPDIAEKLSQPATKGPAYSKVDATREAAARAGCVVLYKGPDTVIADPSGRCSINSAAYERAAPWLATAGSGDVLAGFIAGLLARGFAPMQAAETAAWLHVECARSFGPGLIAEDIPEELPKVFRSLGL